MFFFFLGDRISIGRSSSCLLLLGFGVLRVRCETTAAAAAAVVRVSASILFVSPKQERR